MAQRRGFGEFKESLSLAFDVLRRNTLRSFLTVLGMIGVTTIIVIGAVINGLNSNVMGNIQSLGSSTVIVSKFSWATLGRLSPKVLQRKDLNPGMGQRLEGIAARGSRRARGANRELRLGGASEVAAATFARKT